MSDHQVQNPPAMTKAAQPVYEVVTMKIHPSQLQQGTVAMKGRQPEEDGPTKGWKGVQHIHNLPTYPVEEMVLPADGEEG